MTSDVKRVYAVIDKFYIPEPHRTLLAETLAPYDFDEKELYQIVDEYMLSGELPNPQALLDKTKNRKDVKRKIERNTEDLIHGLQEQMRHEPPSIYDAIEPRTPDMTMRYDPAKSDVEWPRPFSYRWMVSGSSEARAVRAALVLSDMDFRGNMVVDTISGEQVGTIGHRGLMLRKPLSEDAVTTLKEAGFEVQSVKVGSMWNYGIRKIAQEEEEPVPESPEEPGEALTLPIEGEGFDEETTLAEPPERVPEAAEEKPEEKVSEPLEDIVPDFFSQLSEMDKEMFLNLEKQREEALSAMNIAALQYIHTQEEQLIKKYMLPENDVISSEALLARLDESHKAIQRDDETIVRKASVPLKFVRSLGASVKGFSVFAIKQEKQPDSYSVEFAVHLARGPVNRVGILKVAVRGTGAELLPWVWTVTGDVYPLDSSGMDAFFGGYRPGRQPIGML
jgi:hypothetical protein